MADMMVRVPISEQDPKVRATNFDEVCLGYTEEEAVAEASRCLNCKKPMCVGGCPVSINIPAFIEQVKERNFEKHTSSSFCLWERSVASSRQRWQVATNPWT